MNLLAPLDPACRLLLAKIPDIIDKVFPLQERFKKKLKYDIADLSELFTSRRPDRKISYLSKPNLLSAYLRYFLPWNVYRLCRTLPSLPLELKDGDIITDLGSGPLTMTIALWCCRPELRKLNLEFHCIDRTAGVLEAGKKIFSALVDDFNNAENSKSSWKIKTIRGEIKNNGTLTAELRGKPSALVSAVNIYNEIFWNFSPVDKDSRQALAFKSARLLNSLCADNGSVFVFEPGIPRSGEFISALRDALIKQGQTIISPCLHQKECPFPGKAK